MVWSWLSWLSWLKLTELTEVDWKFLTQSTQSTQSTLKTHLVFDDERAGGDEEFVLIVERHAESLCRFKVVQIIAVPVENADPRNLAHIKPPLRIDRQIFAAAVKLGFRRFFERAVRPSAEPRKQLAVGRELKDGGSRAGRNCPRRRSRGARSNRDLNLY